MSDNNVYPLGRVLNKYATTSLVSDTTATRTIVVPTNRRWWLYAGHIRNGDSVTRVCYAEIFDELDQCVCTVVYKSLTTTARLMLFNTEDSYQNLTTGPIPMAAGWYVKLSWLTGGASAGGTAESSIDIIEELV